MYFLLKMWAFVLPLWAYVLVGFCPRGFCPRGFCPRGFCPTLVGFGDWASYYQQSRGSGEPSNGDYEANFNGVAERQQLSTVAQWITVLVMFKRQSITLIMRL